MKHQWTIEIPDDALPAVPPTDDEDESEWTLDTLFDVLRDNSVARKAAEIVNYERLLTIEEAKAEAADQARARMRDPGYTPTVDEALADPEGFVAGMTEEKR